MYHLNYWASHGLSLSKTQEFPRIAKNIEEIENIFARSCPELRDSSRCSTIQERCHYYALRLHVSFAISWLCRPALSSRTRSWPDTEVRDLLAIKCKQNLKESLRAFIKLQSLSVFASRSWGFFHNGISSALLLALMDETNHDPEVRRLQGSLINVLSTNILEKDEDSESSDFVLSRMHIRALNTLKSLYGRRSTPSKENERMENSKSRPKTSQNVRQKNAATDYSHPLPSPLPTTSE